jgi:hypothetical protein
MAIEWKRKDIVQHGEKLFVIMGEPVTGFKGYYRVFSLPQFLGRRDRWIISHETLDYEDVTRIGVYTGYLPDEDLK